MFSWLFSRPKKPLTRMSPSELRVEERVLGRQRDTLAGRITLLDQRRRQLFEQGAKERSEPLRRSLAQQFELAATEQAMIARELNLKSKELITVSRVRQAAEQRARAGARQALAGRIKEVDLLRIQAMIEDDSLRAEMYAERLDDVIGMIAGEGDAAGQLGPAGEGVLKAWGQLDTGAATAAEAFESAESTVREGQARQAERT